MVSNIVRAYDEGIDSFHIFIALQCPWDEVNAIDKRIRQSPIRFLIMVMIPLFKDRGV